MAMFVHIASEKVAGSIRRNGINHLRKSHAPAPEIYALPVVRAEKEGSARFAVSQRRFVRLQYLVCRRQFRCAAILETSVASRRTIMKSFSLLLACVSVYAVANAEQLAPQRTKLSQDEIGKWVAKVNPGVPVDKSIIRRGLNSDHWTLRADCARYLASHGELSDVPYLIDALADESQHAGADYPYAGMATTRYWANVALVCITKLDLGYRWDDPVAKRDQAIERWGNYWQSTKHKADQRPDNAGSIETVQH
jgi:hypothetical protein